MKTKVTDEVLEIDSCILSHSDLLILCQRDKHESDSLLPSRNLQSWEEA